MSRAFRPSPAMAVAVTALVIAAGGTSWAAVKLPAKSVGTPQLKNNSVTTPKLKSGAVTAAKLKADTITGAQVNEATLGAVPTAGVGGLTYANVAAPVLGPGMGATAHVDCAPNLAPISGGARVADPATMFLIDSYPQGRGWTVNVANGGSGSNGYVVHVVCARPGADAGPPAPKTGARGGERFKVR